MATVQVRYIVHDVDAAIAFYCKNLGFRELMHPAATFAMLTRGDLRLVLSAASAADDLEAFVATLERAGAHFRNAIVHGVGGKQIMLT